MSNDRFKRGSEWRKWDLHIHTPNSHLNNKYNCTFNDIVNKIKFEQLSVVGVTNYFIIEENEITKLQKELGTDVLLIPNFEFRISDKNKEGEYIHIHVLFNPDTVKLSKVYESLARVRLNNIHEEPPKYCTLENVKNLGAESITVSFDELKNQLETDFKIVDDFLIVGVCRGQGNFRPDEKPRNINLAIKIDKASHFVFGQADDSNFFLNKEGDRANDVPIPKSVIFCSDAHTIDDIGTKFTWIKADLTFEGLKQIIYEPEERVKIQEINPTFEFEKFAFTEIEVSNPVKVFQSEPLQFEKNHIPLNHNLVTIIGGRGTGKSVLINYIANGFKQYNDINSNSIFNLSVNFKIKWKKSKQSTEETFQLDWQHDLPFLFISQSEVKEKVKDAKDLGNEIKKILELETLSFDLRTDETIQNYKNEYNTNQEWFEKRDENNNQINLKSYVEGEIQKNKNLLERITTEENKEKLEKYTANIEKLQSSQSDTENLQKLKNDLTDFQTTTNELITSLNRGIPAIDFKLQIDAIDKVFTEIEVAIRTAEEENTKIKEDFKDFKGDLTSLLLNVERFRTTIYIYERRKKEIEEKEKQLQSALLNKKKIAGLINTELQKQKKIINDSWKKLLQGKEEWTEKQKELMKKIINSREIRIEGEIVFNKTAFYDLIKQHLDGRRINKNDNNELETIFEIKDLSGFIEFLSNIDVSLKKIEMYLLSGIDRFEEIFYELRTRSTYLYVQPEITYKGKTLDKLSAGQKGTIYLCLKLATNIFSQPIIFDQPEDDLDNDFIFKDLINIFKEIKRYRQVIIITHNANIVVNADAEQVIVASNNEEKLSYTSGSLENQVINKAVCDILEGGKIAFQKRKNKYHLN
jgi:ABC-type dipeptide/oligopeptide/nickel transport system ATPase component